jgi:hypothetical protein
LGSLDSSHSTQRAILRICCNLRYHTPEEAADVMKVYNSLPQDVKYNLRKELSVTGLVPLIMILTFQERREVGLFYCTMPLRY